MQPIHLLFLLLICVIWGFTFVAGKAALEHMPPLLFTGLRYILLALILAPFLKLHKGQGRNILIVALTMGSLHFAIFYGGLALSDNVSVTALAVQMGAPFATFLSVFFLGERLGAYRILGLAAAILGVFIMGFDPIIFNNLSSLGLVLLAAFIGAIGSIIMRQMRGVSTFQLQAWIAMLSWPLLFFLSALIDTDHISIIENAGWEAWGGVLYTALGASLIGHAGMFYLLQRYEVSLIMPLTLLAPIFGVVFGVLVWGDVLTLRIVLGGAVTLFGVLLIALRESAKWPERAPMPYGPKRIT